jgi:hypothetical protein
VGPAGAGGRHRKGCANEEEEENREFTHYWPKIS